MKIPQDAFKSYRKYYVGLRQDMCSDWKITLKLKKLSILKTFTELYS